MTHKELIQHFWRAMNQQRWNDLAPFFAPDASIIWEDTSEIFSVEQFVKVNSLYPGNWTIALHRIEDCESGTLSVAALTSPDDPQSFHAVSFFQFNEENLITRLTEYWCTDGKPPTWRQELIASSY